MVSASWKELRKIWSADGLPPLSIVGLASRGRSGALRSRPVAPPRRRASPSSPKAEASRPHSKLAGQRPDYGGGEIYFDGKLIRKDGVFLAKLNN